MPNPNGKPSKVAIELLARTLKPGQRVRVGEGIFLTVDGSGRLRFQWRARLGGRDSRLASGTCDTFDEAHHERVLSLQSKRDGSARRRERGRLMRIEDYVARRWWVDVLKETQPLTQLDYRRVWERDIYPYWKGRTLGDICELEDVDDYDSWLRRRKVHRKGKRIGLVAESAVERGHAIFSRILNHALDDAYIDHNPLNRIKAKRAKRKKLRNKEKAANRDARPILRSEIPSLRDVELIRLHMPGHLPIEFLLRRTLIELLAYVGLRPGEALSLRHRDWRDRFAAKEFIHIDSGVKDVAGHLEDGPTKTHYARDAYLWQAVAESLEALYQAQGRPALDSLVFPNRKGTFMRWDQFRDRSFYGALVKAGLATPPASGPLPGNGAGFFPPYRLRHVAASLMFHVRKPGGGRYSPVEIADHMGHSTKVLLDTYAKVMSSDFHDVGEETMDQVIRRARRRVWGPLPGDEDFVDEQVTLLTAAQRMSATGGELTLLSKSLAARCYRGHLPYEKLDGKLYVYCFDLVWHGLLEPEWRVRSAGAEGR